MQGSGGDAGSPSSEESGARAKCTEAPSIYNQPTWLWAGLWAHCWEVNGQGNRPVPPGSNNPEGSLFWKTANLREFGNL